MEEILRTVAHFAELACEFATVAVVFVGSAEAFVRLVLSGGARAHGVMRAVWVRFATWILLALEFALAADIIATAIAPTWDEIGQLAAIAAIRTILNYFLAKDVETYAEPESRGGEKA